jgi:hypothetical protein
MGLKDSTGSRQFGLKDSTGSGTWISAGLGDEDVELDRRGEAQQMEVMISAGQGHTRR